MRFKVSLGILIFSVFALNAQSQEKVTKATPKSYDQFFEMDASYEIGGGRVNNAMLNRFLFGGFIDEDIKTTNFNRLNQLNIAGQSGDFRWTYRQENRKLFHRESLGFQVNLEWHNIAQIRFTSDLFKTVFYGNSSSVDLEAQLSKSGFFYLNYYGISGGLNRYSNNKKHFYLANIQLNIGNNYQELNLKDATLFTSQNGDKLAFNGQINYAYLESSAYNFGQFHGFGLGLDFLYRYKSKANSVFEFRLDDFGFIRWPKKIKLLHYTDPIIWEGMEVANILQMPDSVFSTSLSDTVNDFLNQNTTSSPTTNFTNFSLHLGYKHNLIPDKLDVEGIIKYWFTGYMYGEHRLNLYYSVNSRLTIIPSVGYGRYSRFNFGIGLKLQQKNGTSIVLGTNYLSGIIVQQKFAGFGGFINFTRQI
ncbi:MAG: hypothetical protein JXR34_01575 [Bacteroidales bacterium]|nr:hypothetical protein [Bacteroidales bacterium]